MLEWNDFCGRHSAKAAIEATAQVVEPMPSEGLNKIWVIMLLMKRQWRIVVSDRAETKRRDVPVPFSGRAPGRQINGEATPALWPLQ